MPIVIWFFWCVAHVGDLIGELIVCCSCCFFVVLRSPVDHDELLVAVLIMNWLIARLID